jgi:transcriptional regulator with XRE-family HTH domain
MDQPPNRIRELRIAAGMSQQALADAIHVSKMTVSELERGQMNLTQDYMRRIGDALGMLPADILPVVDNPDALSFEERRLLELWRAASPVQREQLARIADVIAPLPAPDATKGRSSAA